jgi:hypothetical protein
MSKLNGLKSSPFTWLNFLKLNYTESQSIKTGTEYLYNKYGNVNVTNTSSNLNMENFININFLRQERLYTKLKYSRSPAFDIVSGGAAALLAGFVGFLISEKFGFELVDSGDFYYLFMYIVFGSFLLKPLLYTINVQSSIISAVSPRNIFNFFIKIFLLSIKIFK